MVSLPGTSRDYSMSEQERMLLDMGKHVSRRVADMMNQAFAVIDDEEEQLVLVLVAMSRMLQTAGLSIGETIPEFKVLPPALQIMAIAMILGQTMEGQIEWHTPNKLQSKLMELAMRRVVERTQAYAHQVNARTV